MGMYVLQGEHVQTSLKTSSYEMTVTAMSDGTITTSEVFQFVLADRFKEIQLDAPIGTKAALEGNTVTWQVGTLNPVTDAKTSSLVLGVSAKHENELQEGDLIASNIVNDFISATGTPMQQTYDDFTFSDPEFRLDITLKLTADCVYTLKFKATNLSTEKDLKDVFFNYTLDTAFTWISPPGNPSFTETKWTVGNLAKGASVEEEAIIRYTGAASIDDKVIFSSISGSAKYDGFKSAKYKGIYDYKQDVEPCPTTLECCEDCPVESGAVIFTECEQSLPATVTPVLTSEGKEIKVHINLNPVCLSKHVVVGLELHEVIDTNTLETVRRALKVIHLTPSGEEGCGERECNCATFYIPPKDNASTDPTCDQQTFIIKAKAHHYYVDEACECSTCNI